ncbi:MAG: leucyl/phenylalanyl-tRNA--protein transferase [Sphingobacteriia bacterium]|nr:leucyl/phenylalanyl-tRNA--protein transferase [Sphingobacteriia bacterium]
MPVIALEDKYRGYSFSAQAEKEGLVAIGGQLNVKTLLDAYRNGIFPWFTPDDPILWWSPDPRMILIPENFKLSHSMRNVLNKNIYEIRIDTAFKDVIVACSKISRPGQDGTWITPEIIRAYNQLHSKGYAHSFETWYNGKLVGGLYGVSIGKAFFGESMFFKRDNASKFAFYHLVQFAKTHNFLFIDAQQATEHLKSLGAETIPRREFLTVLKKAIDSEDQVTPWKPSL